MECITCYFAAWKWHLYRCWTFAVRKSLASVSNQNSSRYSLFLERSVTGVRTNQTVHYLALTVTPCSPVLPSLGTRLWRMVQESGTDTKFFLLTEDGVVETSKGVLSHWCGQRALGSRQPKVGDGTVLGTRLVPVVK